MGELWPRLTEVPQYESAEQLAAYLPVTLSPSEVLALDVHLTCIVEEATKRERWTGRPGAEAMAADRFGDDLDRALGFLPTLDVDYAHDVFALFAGYPDEVVRARVGARMPALTRVDHDRGLTLWLQLVDDPDTTARYSAYEPLEKVDDALKALNFEAVDAELANLGITWEDAKQLLDTYQQARRRQPLYEAGAVALKKLVEASKRR